MQSGRLRRRWWNRDKLLVQDSVVLSAPSCHTLIPPLLQHFHLIITLISWLYDTITFYSYINIKTQNIVSSPERIKLSWMHLSLLVVHHTSPLWHLHRSFQDVIAMTNDRVWVPWSRHSPDMNTFIFIRFLPSVSNSQLPWEPRVLGHRLWGLLNLMAKVPLGCRGRAASWGETV